VGINGIKAKQPNHSLGLTRLKIGRAAQFNRWAAIITLDVNHAVRYYFIYDQIIQM
jgi:hypothetical protein